MNKRNGLIISGVALSTAGVAATVYLKDRSRREKVTDGVKQAQDKVVSMFSKSKNKEEDNFPIDKGGNPDPQDVEDNKMVSEGAQYSVQYYNDNKQQ
ncbi:MULTISPECIES: hypothetical protein [Bacillaceae]|uniref:YtxH domain-containing protein n=1 Tax=Metabacillus sediminis TaxID=3117746 RepID=A0ABZ2NEM1_9BACI|nr:hypothetical protein [Bacillus sp. SJS]KZZ83330.1 hypothetical protein AS29_016395 [Bacillus sp. SJS]